MVSQETDSGNQKKKINWRRLLIIEWGDEIHPLFQKEQQIQCLPDLAPPPRPRRDAHVQEDRQLDVTPAKATGLTRTNLQMSALLRLPRSEHTQTHR